MINMPPKELGCHRTGFKTKCLGLVSSGKCNRWVGLEGSDPVSGEKFSRGDCADNWPITLLLDIAAKVANGTLGVQQATESMRNNLLWAMGAPGGMPDQPKLPPRPAINHDQIEHKGDRE